MIDSAIIVLCGTAAAIGFVHTITGPDHYLPFIVMSKARNWSMNKTMLLTFVCGLGHVLSSVVLGLIGIGFGIMLSKLEWFEGVRGGFAAQAMMIFGFSYCVWGIWRAIKNKPHTHKHFHDGEVHEHEHSHNDGHAHVHVAEGKRSITPWVLFTIFVLGPCEPLIPLLMFPAAESSVSGTILVAAVFSVVTISTMMAVVLVSSWGVSFIKLGKVERYAHAMAGGAILLSGMAIQFLGL